MAMISLRAHEAFDCAAGDVLALPAQMAPDLAGAIATLALVIDAFDIFQILRILLRSVRGKLGITRNSGMGIIGGWGDRQNTANRLDPKLTSVIINEGDHLRNGRSSSVPLRGNRRLRR